jgi:protein TonB
MLRSMVSLSLLLSCAASLLAPSSSAAATAAPTGATALLRTSGDPNVAPDTQTFAVLRRAEVDRVVGVFEVCVDRRGAVSDVRVLRSTTFRTYDVQIVRRIRTWTYQPVLLDGVPTPACTKVTFLYQLAR